MWACLGRGGDGRRCALSIRMRGGRTMTLTRRAFLYAVTAGASGLVAAHSVAQTDPLPFWNDTLSKTAIIEFVKRVTTVGGPDFVATEERIATFDNDGTLWAEQPVYFQVAFALDEVKRLGPQHPE
jgi:hypothetical protein